MKKSFLTGVVLCIMLMFFSSACLILAGSGKQKTAEKKQLVIGFDAMNVSMTWMKFAHDAMVEEAKNLGVKFIVLDSENDVAKQASNMEDLVALGVDGIITDPIDINSLNPAINEASKKGVVVATFDRAAVGADYAFYVGCDDVEGGRRVADFVAEKTGGKAKIVHITGTPGSSPARDRTKGFFERLEKYPGLQVVFDQTGEFWREKGMQVMEDAITSTGGDFDAVVCQDDDMMVGALQAMQSAGINLKDVVVTGYDGVPDGLRAVRDGLADCTVQYPIGQAPEVLRRLVNYLQGKAPAEKDYEMPPWIITKENLDTGDFYSLIVND
jgi:ABC-type sugar transport system substrate-binding protein